MDSYFPDSIWIHESSRQCLVVWNPQEIRPGYHRVLVKEFSEKNYRYSQMSVRKLRRLIAHNKYKRCPIDVGDLVSIEDKPGLHKVTQVRTVWGYGDFLLGHFRAFAWQLKLEFKG